MPPINLLLSKHLPTAWTDLLPWNNLTNQQPYAFHTHIRLPGNPLASTDSYTGPDDAPVITRVTIVPECVHKHYRQLPKDERKGGENALILEGEWVYNVFAAGGAFSVDVIAWVLAPADGKLEIAVPVNVHYNPRPGGDGSPGAALWRLCIDDSAGDWNTFQHGFQDRQWTADGALNRVTANQVVTLRLQLDGRSQAGIDFFTDLQAWRADFTPDAVPEPIPPPEVPVSGGVPYVVIANLLPQDATLAEKAHVLELVHHHKQTILQSAHDAARLVAPGLPGSFVAVWDAHRWPNAIEPWLLDRGVHQITHRTLSHAPPLPIPPAPPLPNPPTPQPPPQQPTYTLRSNNLIGLHSGFTRAQSFPYIEQSGTTVQKFFSAGDAYLAAKAAPGIVSVWRKYVGNEQGRIWEQPTIRESAAWYLNLYTAEIETARTNMGLTLAQFLQRKLALESLNETIPTFNPTVLHDAVEFDVHFCDLAHQRYGDAIDTVLLCGAIGNPHESEVPLLLPAAKAAADHQDYLGYHCYWTDNQYLNNPTFLTHYWNYHAGRWMEWDTYFSSKGVYPRYVSGEGGTVFAWDGASFNSGLGWKACGSFEKYLEHIDTFNTNALTWNRDNNNRFAGLTLFGYANWGWDNFELGDGDVSLLLDWALGRPPTAPADRSLTALHADRNAYITALNTYLTKATYISTDHRQRLAHLLIATESNIR